MYVEFTQKKGKEGVYEQKVSVKEMPKETYLERLERKLQNRRRNRLFNYRSVVY